MLVDIKKAKTAELEAELALYREANVPVKAAEELTNNAKRVEEIENLAKEHGYPVKLDADFIADNAVLAKHLIANGAKEGEIVFAEDADVEVVQKIEGQIEFLKEKGVDLTGEETPEELDKKVSEFTAGHTTPGTTANTPPANNVAAKATRPSISNVAKVATNIEMVFQKKTVIRTSDVVIQGKLYKEVAVATGETFRLTPEEYKSQVVARKES